MISLRLEKAIKGCAFVFAVAVTLLLASATDASAQGRRDRGRDNDRYNDRYDNGRYDNDRYDDDRYNGREKGILAGRHRLYQRTRKQHPHRWSGETRDWSPAPAVVLNPHQVLNPQAAA